MMRRMKPPGRRSRAAVVVLSAKEFAVTFFVVVQHRSISQSVLYLITIKSAGLNQCGEMSTRKIRVKKKAYGDFVVGFFPST